MNNQGTKTLGIILTGYFLLLTLQSIVSFLGCFVYRHYYAGPSDYGTTYLLSSLIFFFIGFLGQKAGVNILGRIAAFVMSLTQLILTLTAIFGCYYPISMCLGFLSVTALALVFLGSKLPLVYKIAIPATLFTWWFIGLFGFSFFDGLYTCFNFSEIVIYLAAAGLLAMWLKKNFTFSCTCSQPQSECQQSSSNATQYVNNNDHTELGNTDSHTQLF